MTPEQNNLQTEQQKAPETNNILFPEPETKAEMKAIIAQQRKDLKDTFGDLSDL